MAPYNIMCAVSGSSRKLAEKMTVLRLRFAVPFQRLSSGVVSNAHGPAASKDPLSVEQLAVDVERTSQTQSGTRVNRCPKRLRLLNRQL
jgi:hypothetical protein